MSANLLKRKAFTLVELMVALTVFAVVAVSVYSTFHAGINIWYRLRPLMVSDQSRTVFFNTLSSDLKNAIIYNTAVDEKKTPDAKEPINFEGTATKMSFMCIERVYDPVYGLRGEPIRVTYILDKENKSVKRRVATKNEGLDDKFAKSIDYLSAVEPEDFGFEYGYKKAALTGEVEVEWKKTWDEKNAVKIPQGVKIRVGESSQVVFIPMGELGAEE